MTLCGIWDSQGPVLLLLIDGGWQGESCEGWKILIIIIGGPSEVLSSDSSSSQS
jgi:hypothetical protein